MSSKHEIVVLAIALIVSITTTVTQCQELMTPLNINITVVNGVESRESGQCPSNEMREKAFNETDQQVRSLLSEYLEAKQPDPLYTCNGTPGWRRVVFIDMTDTSYNCPLGLNLTSYSKRTCGQTERLRTDEYSCSSTTFSLGGSEYSEVCGRMREYQVGLTSGLFGSTSVASRLGLFQTIEGAYVSGISLTHGAIGGRQHIWTFAAGLNEGDPGRSQPERCPCDVGGYQFDSPPFFGDDYFCESGVNNNEFPRLDVFYMDPLWDGQNCISTSTCCEFNNPPWFTKTLPSPTTDNIELRLCLTDNIINEDVAIELVELYVR